MTADRPRETEKRLMEAEIGGRIRALAVFFGAGGALCLLAPLFPTALATDDVGIAAVGAIALVAAALMLRWPSAWPGPLFHGSILAGNVLISLVVLLAGPGASSAVWSQLYVWAPVYSAAYCRRAEFVFHLASTVALHALVLAALEAGPEAVTRVVVTAATGLVASVVVSQLVRRVRALAATDDLTGVANRRAFEAALEREHARALRQGTSLCVAILDLDGFKQHNDLHGHARGDEILREVAEAWRVQLQPGDVLARLGGDEFGLVLPGSALARATELGDGLLSVTPEGVGASMGVCGDVGLSTSQMLRAADAAIYRAKQRPGAAVASDASGHPETADGCAQP
jgi:diguanylate cyclase (GGDEF)-like protein